MNKETPPQEESDDLSVFSGMSREDLQSAAAMLAPAFKESLSARVHDAAGRAMAEALKRRAPDVLGEEVLANYRAIEDENTRNAVARAGIRAAITRLADFGAFPMALAEEVIHAFHGLDAGTTRGVAVRDDGSTRRDGAPHYDDLARFLAMEVTIAMSWRGVSRDGAIALVTGVMREGTKGPHPQEFNTASFAEAGVSFTQLHRLVIRGLELLGADGVTDAQEAGQAIAEGRSLEPELKGYRDHWLRVFDKPAAVRAVLRQMKTGAPTGSRAQKKVVRGRPP